MPAETAREGHIRGNRVGERLALGRRVGTRMQLIANELGTAVATRMATRRFRIYCALVENA